MNELKITLHGMRRACERLLEVEFVEKTDKACFEKHAYLFKKVEEFLHKSITPYQGDLVDGATYHAMIDGFDEYRARIRVQEGKHVLLTIVEVGENGHLHNREHEKRRKKWKA